MGYQKFIGIPFKPHGRTKEGFDCIGLTIAVLKESGQLIPDVWQYDTPDGAEAAANFLVELISIEEGTSKWKPCEPSKDAVVLFKIAGLVRHIGVMINEVQFIHTMYNVDTCVESIDSPVWKKRIAGFYKWSG